jgi:hypothetical protein
VKEAYGLPLGPQDIYLIKVETQVHNYNAMNTDLLISTKMMHSRKEKIFIGTYALCMSIDEYARFECFLY